MTEQQIADNKARFIATCREKITRKGIERLLEYLEKTDFYTAPTSTQFHLNEPGGLCKHSLNVYETAVKLYREVVVPAIESGEGPFSEVPQEESVALAALLHDLCKVNLYKPTERWKKDEQNRWISYNGYKVEDEFPFGHGEKSCFFIERFMRLSADELLAVRWHMGMFDMGEQGSSQRYAFYAALEKSPLVALIHAADFLASKCMEKITAI